MNKILTKVTALCVGLAMVAGVGVAVGSKKVSAAHADDTITFTTTNSEISTTGTNKSLTVDGVTLTFSNVSAVDASSIQNAKNATITSSEITGEIKSVKIYNCQTTSAKTDGAFTVYGGVSASAINTEIEAITGLSSTAVDKTIEFDSGFNYFKIVVGSARVLKHSQIDVVYGEGSSATLESIEVTGSMTKTAYTTAESWDPSGLVVTAHYDDSSSKTVTGSAEWTYSPAAPADGVTSVVATASYGDETASSSAQAVTVEVVVAPIVLNSSNWPVTATSTHTNVQQSTLDGIVYENVGGYKYSNQLSLNYAVDNYFGNRTAFSRNIKSIVVVYSTNVTSYVKMYEGSEPCTKTTLVTSSGTTTVTYTFSDTNPYFRLNMTTSTPKGTYCNISSITITLGSATNVVDLEDISVNGNTSSPVGVDFKSSLMLSPANANNKDTIAWSSSNTSVATVNASGVVTCLSAGSTTITATATDLVGVSASYVLTVFAATPIEKLYYMSADDAVDFNGVYVGFSTGTGPIFMNGEFGIVVFDSSKDVTSWTANETIVHITGTLAVYSGLYEVKNATYEVLESASDVATPVTYTVVGGETQFYESRKTYVSGTVTSVSGSWTSDTTVVVDVNGTPIQCFAKANAIDATTGAKIVADAEVTLTGFTGWHNGFQVAINGLIESADEYTAEEFAQYLIDLTDDVCQGYSEGDNNYDALVVVWNTLTNTEDPDQKSYPFLPAAEKTVLVGADADEGGTIVEQAIARYEHICSAYGLAQFIEGRAEIPVKGTYAPSYMSTIDSSSSITIIVIVAVASMTLLGVTLVLRKRKMN